MLPPLMSPERTVAGGPAYIDRSARLCGDVEMDEGSSVWPFVAVRAELHQVRIGRFTNVQDFAMLHVGYAQGVRVGDYCSITHRVTLHGCTIEDACLVGIGATVMDGCVVGRGSIVAGHSFLREGTLVPPCSIVMGTPANVVATRDATVANVVNALLYHRNALAYASGDERAWVRLSQADFLKEAQAIAAMLGSG